MDISRNNELIEISNRFEWACSNDYLSEAHDCYHKFKDKMNPQEDKATWDHMQDLAKKKEWLETFEMG